MSVLNSVVDVTSITNKFKELADIELKNFDDQLLSIIASYLARLKERVQQEVGVSVTGFATDILNDLLADFNAKLNSLFASRKDELANNITAAVNEIVQQVGQNANVDYLAQIDNLFDGKIRPNVKVLVAQFESYAQELVAADTASYVKQ